MSKKIIINFLVLVSLVLAITAYDICRERSFLMQLSLSSDGKYLISSHHGRYLMLWDLDKKRKRTISRDINIFSLYFIPDSHYFLWQRLTNNQVIVQDINGKIIKTFNPGFPVYGHIMKKDLKTYVASDIDWSLYCMKQGKIERFQEDHGGYYGGMKLLGLKFSKDYLLTVGFADLQGTEYPIAIGSNERDIRKMDILDWMNNSLFQGVTLWDLKTYKPIEKFIGNIYKTDGDISKDGKRVIAGDENDHLFTWDTATGKRSSMDEPTDPRYKCFTSEKCWTKFRKRLKEDVKMPKDFYTGNVVRTDNLAVRFIDDNKYFLRIMIGINYAILYSVDSPKIQAYIDLGDNPKPQSFYYADANNIATAPKAKTLVMGQNFMHGVPISKGSGIIVYKFDEKTQTLRRVWVGDGPSWHLNWKNLLGIFS